jgi:hypothetical protein
MYKIFRNNLGKIDAVNYAESGASIPQKEWGNLGIDLSDLPAIPVAVVPDYSGFRITTASSVKFEEIMDAVKSSTRRSVVISAWLKVENVQSLQMVIELWNKKIVPIAEAQSAFLQEKATEFSIPITISSNGFISLK